MQYADPVLDEIEETFARIDRNGDRNIEFDEFAGLMLRMDHTRTEAALRQQFDVIDTDRDGRVSFEDFRAWCEPVR
jgi:Ca2+-binding EF-hand superfamily protein